ncbi:MAG: DUF401 family protein [Nitrospirae bacterium]|nr:DUF401 family protein [Nitrospirota bacterium]
MADILKITVIFIIVVLLLKRRWNLGIIMILSSIILSVFYLLKPAEFFSAFLKSTTEKTTLGLVISLTFIRVFENIMRNKGLMQGMMKTLRGVIIDRRVLMASMPALIGLLPSMGGALFSAPMVEEAASGANIREEKKAFINYWFRHPWEFILPLYPGVVLLSALSKIPLRDLIIANMPYAIALLAGGAVWGLRGITIQREGFKRMSKEGLLSFMPLALILVMVIVFHIDLSVSLTAAIMVLFAALRYSASEVIKTFKEGISLEILVIILGVMTFKAVLESSGAVVNISRFFTKEGIPLLPVLFIIPFISGLLTGLTVGFVGSTFPIILGLEGAQGLGAISFAFASGYLGVLLSPVHLCFVLTKEYFKAEMPGLYKKTIMGSILIFLTALSMYFIRR